MTRTWANEEAISTVSSLLKLSTTTISRAQARRSSVRPMFAASLQVRISGVMCSSILSLDKDPLNLPPPFPTNNASQTRTRLFLFSSDPPHRSTVRLIRGPVPLALYPTPRLRLRSVARDSPAALSPRERHAPSLREPTNQSSP